MNWSCETEIFGHEPHRTQNDSQQQFNQLSRTLPLCCGLVATGPEVLGFDSWIYQIFRETVGLERGPLSLVRVTEELLD
jgi:hypothetical protein